MNIDLQKLNYTDKIDINEKISYNEEYLINSDIVSLDNVNVIGNITYDIEDNYVVNLNVNGIMMLHDAINNEIIPYEFAIEIEEILEKSLKSLDLIEFLWHYIVLEVPLRYTLCEDSHQEGNDYRVISEEEYEKTSNNPFKDFHLE